MVTWVYLIPAITAVIVLFLPRENAAVLRIVALLGAVVAFLAACKLLLRT